MRVFIRRTRGDCWAAQAVEAIEADVATELRCSVLAVFPGERVDRGLREHVIMFRCPGHAALDAADERLRQVPDFRRCGEFPNVD